MRVEPYLFFDGRCEQAVEFYQKTVGAKVVALIRYKENPEPKYNPPGSDEKVMHGLMHIGDTPVMVSDGNCTGKPSFSGFSLTLNAKNPDEAKRLFAALSEGGKVEMPLGETFFAESFGMLADKFGVGWMVMAGPKNP
jgi:PhnB protein